MRRDDAGEAYGVRAFVRDLPGQLREVTADGRRLGRSLRDLWPLMWVANADRQIEFYSQQAFDGGAEYGRQQAETEAAAALESAAAPHDDEEDPELGS